MPNPILYKRLSGIDPNALANRFLSAAGITNVTQRSAIITLTKSLKSYGILNKFYALYPVIGGTATSHSFNLINTSLFRITWVNSPSQDANGVDFNGISQYGKTGLIPSSIMTLHNTSVHFYSRDNVAGTTVDAGSVNAAATNLFRLFTRIVGDQVISDQYDGTNGRLTVANADSRGLFTALRTSSTFHEAYKNGVSLGSNATAGGALPDVEFYLGCQNLGDTPGAFSARQCAFFAIGKGFTSVESANLYTAVQTYQTTLGRNI